MIIGIDLGTTNSAAAFFNNREPEIIPNDRGARVTPSVVAYNGNQFIAGEAARNQHLANPSGTVRHIKRYMGSSKKIILGDNSFTPEEISAHILTKIKKDAEKFLGTRVQKAVITVPAYFNEKQRRATMDAGAIAGLEVVRIISEPTATALAYAYSAPDKSNILVYDLGGGTFDVSCLRKEGVNFKVLSTCGDTNLGGIDFDQMLLKEVLQKFEKESGRNLTKDPLVMQQLTDAVEKAKIELSSSSNAYVSLPFLSAQGQTLHLQYRLNREELEKLITESITRTISLTRQAVKDAGLAPGDINTLILAGGSTRIPLIQKFLQKEFNKNPQHRINPEEVVALGAAVQAHLLEKNGEEVLQDVTPFALGVEIDGGRFIQIIKRNTPIPARGEKTFTTIADDQESVEVHVLQGTSAIARNNTSLGRFLLSGIRKAKKGMPHINVVFGIDKDGLLQVEAKDRQTGVKQKVVINRDQESENDDKALRAQVRGLRIRLQDRLKQTSFLEKEFRNEIDVVIQNAVSNEHTKDLKKLWKIKMDLEVLLGEFNMLAPEGNYEEL